MDAPSVSAFKGD